MSMGMIKSGEYVPCGASATLMSQYPSKPTTDIITVTQAQLYNGWTAPASGMLYMQARGNSGDYPLVSVNGVTMIQCIVNTPCDFPSYILLNKDDVVVLSHGFMRAYFRPFAVGEVL